MRLGKYIWQYRGITAEIQVKQMRTCRLYVQPPDGRIRFSVPVGTSETKVKAMLDQQWDWITKTRTKILEYPACANLTQNLLPGDEIQLWGESYRLEWGSPASQFTSKAVANRLSKKNTFPEQQQLFSDSELANLVSATQPADPSPFRIEQSTGKIYLQVTENTTAVERFNCLQKFYKQEIAAVIPELFAKWGEQLSVTASAVRLRRMKTKWGSCNTKTAKITINTELARFPKPALSYIVLHELAHLHERYHNQKFWDIVAGQMPDWKKWRDLLNQQPLVLTQPDETQN